MARSIAWSDLLEIYQNAKWQEGDNANVFVQTENIAQTFELVETSDKAEYDANLAALVDQTAIGVGKTIPARIGSPRLSLGVLADNWDGVIASPEARTREPTAFFIKGDSTHSGKTPPTEQMVRYRKMLEFVGLLGKTALFLDVQRQTFVYFKENRVEIPIRFEASDLKLIDPDGVSAIREALDGAVHTEQRLAILTNAVIALTVSQPSENRFMYLAQNAGEIASRVRDGYRLFASSFSYSKIRGEVEAAQSDYVSRMHKTFVDIQGQLLGLPVATVVVATQLKAANVCGPEAWANLAVTAGAWLFAALLIGSCVNQWYTLKSIGADIDRQSRKLTRDFSEISAMFSDAFKALKTRLCWHRTALIVICGIALSGAVFATVVFRSVTGVDILGSCLK
ncbi:hypothetical protein GCM10010869_60210 [Mesorhizobium tianshanense]|uniref:Uncharacterized protein n=1 Tax=Mesorhizobium tianshanense TaxID=39844 RepID=A0A562P6G3_9HYPH|nr:hypothetical protein [Mesorhizobium tianshanense]TWI40047.1 hypothetical protein IQ26_01652 [Mesorhizobium tianshanense]GLS40424.1 hypothetical protein GCM10010869_60210 [Mesorhizobium tianshanense]